MGTINKFGRLHAPDERDQGHLMRAFIQPAPLPSWRYYRVGPGMPFDQGETGTCVAQAVTGFRVAAPLMAKAVPSAFDTYRGLVLEDEFPGNDREATAPDHQLQYGSSIRGGMKYGQKQGWVKSYVWAQGAEDMALWILTGKGCVIMGTRWDENMSDLDSKGFAHQGGMVLGGHAYLCIGFNRKLNRFTFINSWGPEWGLNGRFYMSFADVDALVHDDGEACSAIEQKVAA